MTSREESVAIVTNEPAPYRLPVFEDLSQEFDLTVYFCRTTEEDRHWEPDLSKYGDWHKQLSFRRIGPLILNPDAYSTLVDGNYDAILVGDNARTIPTTVAALLAARHSGAGFGIWTEGIDTGYYHQQGSFSRPFVELFRQIIYSKSDICLGYSNAAGRWLRTRQVEPTRIVTGTQVVPAQILPSTPPDSQFTTDGTKVVSLGYLEDRKGVVELLHAFRNARLEGMTLSVAGDGPKRNEIERIAADDPTIQILGYIDEETKAELLEAADLFVFPTKSDPWGLVVNEALHFDTPVIATEMAASSELLTATGAGIVLPDAEIMTIRETLTRIKNDEDLLTTLQRRASRVDCASDVKVGTVGFRKAFRKLCNI
jgi:glycosyltransferase involved in cell wall biosynthesis